jgi:hypothetical protein
MVGAASLSKSIVLETLRTLNLRVSERLFEIEERLKFSVLPEKPNTLEDIFTSRLGEIGYGE